jgi:hypothetical protein
MARTGRRLRLPRPGYPPPSATKQLLVRAGELASENAIYGFLGLFNYVHLGWWLKRKQFPMRALVENRERVFEEVAAAVRGRRVLYLEFGVANGYSMGHWSRLLDNPGSQLHGFDSFEGLPSDWALGWSAGSFTPQGGMPVFDDDRIELFKGWFTETLPKYVWPEGYEILIVNVDCDLYSSADYVLRTIEEHLTPGTILYFDEFHHYADELRAFDELVQRTGWSFEILAASRDYSQIAFTRVA